MNPILAILENKGLITEDEALGLADYLANGIHSVNYKDAQSAVKKILAEK